MDDHEHSAAAAVESSKTIIDSLPDELLQRIVLEVAGNLVFDKGHRGYVRSSEDKESLRNLALVNQRFSRIARLELYRAPGSLIAYQRSLTSDDLDILLHPMVVSEAEFMALAGTCPFFASLLEDRFPRLSSLTLNFTYSPTADRGPGDEAQVGNGHRAVVRLHKALEALPLRELYIHIRNKFHVPACEYWQAGRLAAGHNTLRHLSIECPPGAWHGTTTETAAQTPTTSSLISLDLGRFHGDIAHLLQTGLGSLPDLAELSINCRPGLQPQQLHALGGLLPETCPQVSVITWLDLKTEYLSFIWRELGKLPNLRNLTIHSESGGPNGFQIEGVPLSRLETIRIEFPWTWSISTVILRQAAYQSLFPSLSSCHLSVTKRKNERRLEHEEARQLLVAYDEFVISHVAVRVTPSNFSDVIVGRLKDTIVGTHAWGTTYAAAE